MSERSDDFKDLRSSAAFLRGILESSNDCIKVLDLDSKLVFMSEGGKRVMEVDDFEKARGCPWPDFWQQEGNIKAKAAVAEAKKGIAARFEGYANTMRGNERYWDVQVSPIFDKDGKPESILAVSRDITNLKKLEIERLELAREISHRLKNSLAMVQAIVQQSFRNSKDLQTVQTAISGRLAALAIAQDILTATDRASAKVDVIVNAVLAPYRDAEHRFQSKGPDLELSEQKTLGLSLAIHELATNAIKNGALSTAEGHIKIVWTISPEGVFNFQWKESGGPIVAVPFKKGFGSKLLESIVPSYFNGAAKLHFEPAGVVFELEGQA